jgi:hypothetical protein
VIEFAHAEPRTGGRWRQRRRVLVRSALAASMALAALFVAPRVSAYCRTTTCPTCDYDAKGCPTGDPLFWPSSCVTFSMQYEASKQVDLPTATTVMEKAFAIWQAVTCGESGAPPAIRVDHHFGDVACTVHEYNQTDANANIVMFRDDVWPYEGSANVLGLTTVTYSRRTGAIFDVDMELNGTHRLSVEEVVPPSSYDLQSIATHEAGHFLGLTHSTDRSATMWHQYTAGSDSFRMLADDDILGICSVFPPTTPAHCDPAPRQGFSPTCGIFPSGDGGKCSVARVGTARHRSAGWGGLGLGALAAALAIARRRVRRGHAEGR